MLFNSLKNWRQYVYKLSILKGTSIMVPRLDKILTIIQACKQVFVWILI